MMGGEKGGWKVDSSAQIGLHIKYEHPTRPRTLSKVSCGWWADGLWVDGWWVGGWSKGILEFRFGPNLGLGT